MEGGVYNPLESNNDFNHKLMIGLVNLEVLVIALYLVSANINLQLSFDFQLLIRFKSRKPSVE